MVKFTRSPDPPPSLEVEKAKKDGKYDLPDVRQQLRLDFHGKCYLCEIGRLQSEDVEHLRPKANRPEVRFDWNNLFLSCHHCNMTKTKKKYDGTILDCCREDPEKYLKQTLTSCKENGITTVHVQVVPIADSPTKTAIRTAELIEDCFELLNTGAREGECQVRIDELSEEMNILKNRLRLYLRQVQQNKSTNRSLIVLKELLDRSHPFAGFLRTYVREHLDKYPDLAEYVKL